MTGITPAVLPSQGSMTDRRTQSPPTVVGYRGMLRGRHPAHFSLAASAIPWGGAQLAQLLQEARVLDQATEVVFYGVDRGTMTIRDNTGIGSGGLTGTVEPDAGGGRGTDRSPSSSLAACQSAKRSTVTTCSASEMNGESLPLENGFPVRLIAPGWYGWPNVKWLTRIEVTDHRYAGNFMARDYVSPRRGADATARPSGRSPR